MARGKKTLEDKGSKLEDTDDAESFSKELIKDICKTYGTKEVYDFSDEKFEDVSRWIPSGCTSLDYLIANKRGGGYPEGKVIEIFGPSGIGKSLLGYQAIRSAQQMGGIDTEYATYPPYLEELGVNTRDNFVFSPQKCTEKVLDLIDKIITRTVTLAKGRPVVIVWDSVAASVPKKVLEGEYEQTTIGMLARALSQGLPRIIQPVAEARVTLILLNQTRTKIGVMYGDPEDSCGGAAMKYYPSLRVKLSGGRGIFEDEAKKENRIGNGVIATIVKSRVAKPNRKCEFDLIFGLGSYENDQLFDEMRQKGTVHFEDKKIVLEGTGAWKTWTVSNKTTGEILHEEKFYKHEFTTRILKNPEYKNYIDALLDAAFIKTNDKKEQNSNEEE